jgi:hypothetical protein
MARSFSAWPDWSDDQELAALLRSAGYKRTTEFYEGSTR